MQHGVNDCEKTATRCGKMNKWLWLGVHEFQTPHECGVQLFVAHCCCAIPCTDAAFCGMWDQAAIPKTFHIATTHALSSLTFCRSSRKQLQPANPASYVKTVDFDKEAAE